MIKQQVIPSSYKLVSFDVKFLFTNVPLDRTIDIVLKRIYDKHEITTNIGRKEMKDLITLCTKNVLFTFNNEIYQQRDGQQWQLLQDQFLQELSWLNQRTILPELNSHLQFWKRYVDDTLTIVKEGLINHVLQQLNSFHPNIQFTFEIESSGRIPFLDILIIRKKSKIETKLVLICTQLMETRNVKKPSSSSLQYLLYKISFEEGIATPRKKFYF